MTTSFTFNLVVNVEVDPTTKFDVIVLIEVNNGDETPLIITFCLVNVITPAKLPLLNWIE